MFSVAIWQVSRHPLANYLPHKIISTPKYQGAGLTFHTLMRVEIQWLGKFKAPDKLGGVQPDSMFPFINKGPYSASWGVAMQ